MSQNVWKNAIMAESLTEWDIDVGDPMLKIKKCCEGDRAAPTPQKSENKFQVIWLSMKKESNFNALIIVYFSL